MYINSFTKSNLKLALACETSLYYASRPDEYADRSTENSFLASLADGGFQVGALAWFLLADDPVGSGLVGEATSREGSIEESTQRLGTSDAVMAEATFSFENFLVRADLVRKSGSVLEVFEVKAKSYSGSKTEFWKRRTHDLASEWRPYLYDIAFQTWVIRHTRPDLDVRPRLVLADKSLTATVDGINQFFKLTGTDSRERIQIKPGLSRSDLGTLLVTPVDVSDEVDFLLDKPYESEAFGFMSFDAYVRKLAEIHLSGQKVSTKTGVKCKKCPFRADPGSEDDRVGKKSGFHECWKERHGLDAASLLRPTVLDIWSYTKLNENIDRGCILLADLAKEDLWRDPISPSAAGLSSKERQRLQVIETLKPDPEPWLFKSALAARMKDWNYPLHFIDFETCAPALPFTAGRHPYEIIAFQFSAHTVYEDGRIEHAAQYLDSRIGVHPNYDFLRALKRALGNDEGTVFRYAAHEKTVLKQIRIQLLNETTPPPDRDELVAFIESITYDIKDQNDQARGRRSMVDMLDLVKKVFYHPSMKGSNSIKQVLPATIASSTYLREKYSKPVYGTADLPSLNVTNHIWIDARMDPYKTLAPLFDDIDPEELENLSPVLGDMDEIKEGGAAMTAYCKLQFSEVPEAQRQALVAGLYRYCELDTMAMVMIYEYWKHEIDT